MVSPESIMALFTGQNVAGEERERTGADLAECERQLTEVARRLSNLLDPAENGDIDRLTFRERKARLDKERTGVIQTRDGLASRLNQWQRARITKEDAERLARHWQEQLELVGKPFLGALHSSDPSSSGDVVNAFEQQGFRRWALGRMSVTVTIEPSRTLVRGTITELKPQWSAQVGDDTENRAARDRAHKPDDSLYCTTHRHVRT